MSLKKKIPICIYNKQCGDCSSTCTGNIAFCKRNGHADQIPWIIMKKQ